MTELKTGLIVLFIHFNNFYSEIRNTYLLFIISPIYVYIYIYIYILYIYIYRQIQIYTYIYAYVYIYTYIYIYIYIYIQYIYIIYIYITYIDIHASKVEQEAAIKNSGYKNACNSGTIYIVLFAIAFLIITGISIAYFYSHWYLKRSNTDVINIGANTETVIY